MSDTNFKRLDELEVIEEAGESTYAVVEENGVPKRIPGNKIGLPTGGAPYQQLVTDGQGVAKWEDKPFYKKIGEVVIIPETTFLPENIMGSSGISIANPELITFIEGQTYTVIYDNNTYEVIAAPDSGIVALSLEDVNVKIAIVPGAEEVFTVLTPDGWGVEHIIKVTTIETVITKIDSKFMPEGYPRTETKEVTLLPETSVNFDIDLSDGLIQCSMSGSFEAIKPGKTYVVTVNGKSYICKADGGVVDNIYEAGQIGVMPDEEFNESMPFSIFTHSQWSGDIMFVTRSDLLPNPSTFTIVEIEEIIKPLDPKYLPVVVFSEVYDPETGSGTGECTCTHTFEEYVALVRSCNCPPRAVFRERSKTGSYNIFVDAWLELMVAFLGDYQSDDLATISFGFTSPEGSGVIRYSKDSSITLEKN